MTGNGMFLRLMQRLEESDRLDPAVHAAEPLAARLVANRRLRSFFHGDATGIPPHVIATDVPFGAWFMAIFLDLFPDPGSRRAAARLVALGVVAAGPTGLSGWAEWARADHSTRRVGVIHAAANLAATLIFLASWVARSRERHRLGVRLARLGGVVLILGGFLGGYMRSASRP
ncbi:hypothetical protein BJG92_00961 [Arthrobacter sp. SO5]|uniref:DUF2231 domain-containing protein n=1 Tax=Arthrobacter sp. SO5 TaxID=1897055 RepID=UPI001E402930|nr:DUF2231 domain-containing protein [Arthrobacter sp. SO5]MCB5273439.1 hypothetical protein [Arthrobacter sp. SO5]